jgi:hypothetical protein
MIKGFQLGILLISLLIVGCKKDEAQIFTDNDAPYYDKVPSVKVRNYVNRLFIDLLGREPLDAEMDQETATLQADNVSKVSREALINKLMQDDAFRDGDTSYTLTYHKRLHELAKIRFIDGIADEELRGQASINRSDAISDSLSGNMVGYEENMAKYARMVSILNSRSYYQSGQIDLFSVYASMVDNSIYDIINMNTFNFVNACFDDLFFRFPTSAEFQIGFSMVEDNTPGSLFGAPGQNRADFVRILTQSNECKLGVVIWAYNTLLARNPTSTEMELEMQQFGADSDLKALQKRILITNEYANF